MVIPKNHHRWVYDVPNFGEYWEFVLEVTKKINANLKPLFISFLTMGNQVEHAHIHIIPRYFNDKLINEFGADLRINFTPDELSSICTKIKS